MTLFFFGQLYYIGIPSLPIQDHMLRSDKWSPSRPSDLVFEFMEVIKHQLKEIEVSVVMDGVPSDKQALLEIRALFDRLAIIAKSDADYFPLRLAVTSTTSTDIAYLCENAKIVNVPNIEEWNKRKA